MLPTAKDTGIGEAATREANKAVREELRRPEANQTKQMCKRKPYSVFSGEQRAQIGKYAAENGNTAAVKRFKDDYDGQLGEITVGKSTTESFLKHIIVNGSERQVSLMLWRQPSNS